MKKISLFIFILLCFFSCDNSTDDPSTPYSAIGFEKTNIELSSAANTESIKSNYNKWFISSYKEIINGDTALHLNEQYTVSDATHQDIIHFKDTIVGDWYKIIKTDDGVLIAILSENNTLKDRILEVETDALMRFGQTITLKQKGN